MANLALSVAPGYYLEAQNASWVLGANVDFVSFTKDGPTPAISKYIAYDTLVPPNPFIAVTQDGAGNVVYDGGFPKFYNNLAPEAGIDSVFSMEYKGTRTAGTPPNTYYYDAFTDVAVTIAAGDRLVYDILMNSADARVGIDATTTVNPATDPTHFTMRDWGGGGPGAIKDQNDIAAHPASDLGGRAVGQWYHREFDLTPCAGYTFNKWSLAYEGEVAGVFYTRFKEVYVINAAGQVKATLFKDSIKLPNSTSTEAGASGYTDTAKYIYDPRSRLTPSFKYLFNAIRWCANPAKAKKILVLGDTIPTGNYPVNSTGPNGFQTSMQRIASACGFTVDIKDVTNYANGKLNPSLAELNTYALVIMLSTAYDVNNAELITPSAVTDLVSFRSQGGGLIFITDHGAQALTNVNQVATAAGIGFYGTANRVIANFGTYFSGNYDRTPVNVGFLRANYGDHPLYSGMTDLEDIAAGGSESKVVLADFQKYTAANIPNVSIANNGVNSIKAIAMMSDGTVETYNFVYVIATGQLLKITDSNGVEINSLPAGYRVSRTFNVEVVGAGLGSIVGDILLNGHRVAELSYSEDLGSVEAWYLGGSQFIPVRNGDIYEVRITSPFTFSRQLVVSRNHPGITVPSRLATKIRTMRDNGLSGSHPNTVIRDALAQMNLDYSHLQNYLRGDSASNLKVLYKYFAGELDLAPMSVYIYPSAALAADAMSRLSPPSQATVFNTWDRFANNDYFPQGVGATGEAAAWVWDDVKQAAVQPLNTGGWVGFVSPDSVDDYEIDVVMKSDNSDDDTNGLVLAFNRTGGINNRLTFNVNMGGHPVHPAPLTIQTFTSAAVVVAQSSAIPWYPNPTFPTDGGWRGRFIRVKATRKGDNFKITTSQWDSLLLDPLTTLEYTLPQTGVAAQFRGPKPWGFINISQAASYFNLRSFKGGQLYDIVVDASSNKVYRYSNGAWSLLTGLEIRYVFSGPRTLVNSETGASFKLNIDGSIIPL